MSISSLEHRATSRVFEDAKVIQMNHKRAEKLKSLEASEPAESDTIALNEWLALVKTANEEFSREWDTIYQPIYDKHYAEMTSRENNQGRLPKS